jgi:hypothetical protein
VTATGRSQTSELTQDGNGPNGMGRASIGIDPMLPPPTFSTPPIPLPNAAGAQAFQTGSFGSAGQYHIRSNNCFTHVADVLRAGGLPVPTRPSGAVLYVRDIVRPRLY